MAQIYKIENLIKDNKHTSSSYTQEIKDLIHSISDPNAKVGDKTLLGICVENGQIFEDLILKLLKKGANPNEKSDDKYPIIIALKSKERRNTNILSMLIKHGADVYVEDKKGNTPLMLLLNPNKYGRYNSGSDELKDFILKYGVNINKPSSKGLLPLNEFIKSLKNQIIALEEYEYEPLKFLGGEYFNQNFLRKYRKILDNEIAIEQKIRVLIKGGANFNTKDCLGISAFDLLKNEKNGEFLKCYISQLIITNLCDLEQLSECEDYNIKILAYTRRWKELLNKNISEEMASFLIQFAVITNEENILKSLKYSDASLDMSVIENIKTITSPSGPWYTNYNLLNRIIKMMLYVKEDIVNDFFIAFSKIF